MSLLLIYAGLTAPSRKPAALQRIEQLLEESGIRGLSTTRFAVLIVGLFIACLIVIAGTTGLLLPALFISTGIAWLPVTVVRSRRIRRRLVLQEAWPDAIVGLIAGLRAGASLAEVCVAQAERGPEVLRPAFRSFAATYRSTGVFEAGLMRLRTEIADPVGDRVTAALVLANEVGGTDLVRVLSTLGDFVRQDLRVRKEIEARWSWTITAARVAVVSPWIVLLLMSTRPEAAAAYNSATGTLIIAVGALMTIAGYRLMLRAARLPQEKRLS